MDELKINVFICYSHHDEELCNELLKHMKQLERANLIAPWHDRKISPGIDWDGSIKERICKADLILFLLSSDFLNSSYIYEEEVKLALQQHQEKKSVVVPIMLRKCDIELTPFSHIQGLPTDLLPVSSNKWFNKDDAFYDVISGLKRIIYEQRNTKEIKYSEDRLWQQTLTANTAAAYFQYIKSSKLDKYYDQAISTIQQLHISDVKKDTQQLKLELEVLNRQLKYIREEVHDDVLSALTCMVLTITIDKDKTDVEQMKTELRSVMERLRNLIKYKEHKENYNDFDLEDAIQNLKKQVDPLLTTAIRIDDLKIPLRITFKINIFRIIQELVQNVLKHAKATLLRLTVVMEENNIVIRCSDNGVGIAQTPRWDTRGIGIRNLRSRAGFYRGTLNIISEEGKGCEVVVAIPVVDHNVLSVEYEENL